MSHTTGVLCAARPAAFHAHLGELEPQSLVLADVLDRALRLVADEVPLVSRRRGVGDREPPEASLRERPSVPPEVVPLDPDPPQRVGVGCVQRGVEPDDKQRAEQDRSRDSRPLPPRSDHPLTTTSGGSQEALTSSEPTPPRQEPALRPTR